MNDQRANREANKAEGLEEKAPTTPGLGKMQAQREVEKGKPDEGEAVAGESAVAAKDEGRTGHEETADDSGA